MAGGHCLGELQGGGVTTQVIKVWHAQDAKLLAAFADQLMLLLSDLLPASVFQIECQQVGICLSSP